MEINMLGTNLDFAGIWPDGSGGLPEFSWEGRGEGWRVPGRARRLGEVDDATGKGVGAAGRRRFFAGGSGAAASSGRRSWWSSGAQTNHRKITEVRKNVVKLMG